ncbi:MAG: SGNH/GDSL hydrolase family protein [Gemmatimonadota bacterium]
MKTNRLAASLVLTLATLMGCHSDESLNSPTVTDPLFQRYVAMGNSITAGFQSGGINDSTQQRSYARLLSLGMQTSFVYPKLNMPGCPAPFDVNTTQHRVGGAAGTDCALNAAQPQLLNDVAVPGNAVGTLLSNFGGLPSSFDPLKTLMAGGRTEIELMQVMHPTLVSLWIGNNDVLGAFISLSNAGDTGQITPLAQFNAQYDSVADAIDATGAKVVAISVANVTNIPFASSAAIYYCLKNGGCPPPFPPQNATLAAIPTFTVNANCAPPAGINYLVPWPIALGKVSAAVGGTPSAIDCADTISVISPEEITAMAVAVASYNAHIQSVAAARGWAYWDINPALSALRAAGSIPALPDISGALSPTPTPIGFGPIFSQDGVHPSSVAHRLIADSVAATLNAKFGTTLPVPVCGTASCPAP